MSVRLARSGSPDSDSRRRAAEDRVRAIALELADAIIDLAALTPAPQQPIELLDVTEAARRLHVARSTLYTLMGEGAVRSVRVGGRVLISSGEVSEIAAGRPSPRAAGARRPPGRSAS